jgi:hypothetical protein
MANGALQDVISTMSAPISILSFVVAVLGVVFIHRMTAKARPYKLFPVWATLEVALTSHLVAQNGIGRRIL